MRLHSFGSAFDNPVTGVSFEGYADGHSIGHKYAAARGDLRVGERSARPLDLVVVVHPHLFVRHQDILHSLQLLLRHQRRCFVRGICGRALWRSR